MIKVGTSCRAKTILETPQPVKEQQVNISGQKALFSIKIIDLYIQTKLLPKIL
jgi:hypothetical protein